jgi:hypothetical protein
MKESRHKNNLRWFYLYIYEVYHKFWKIMVLNLFKFILTLEKESKNNDWEGVYEVSSEVLLIFYFLTWFVVTWVCSVRIQWAYLSFVDFVYECCLSAVYEKLNLKRWWMGVINGGLNLKFLYIDGLREANRNYQLLRGPDSWNWESYEEWVSGGESR